MNDQFNPQDHILGLDFDGVIVNSIQECLVSGFNAYQQFINGEAIADLAQLPPEWTAKARYMRNFIRNGEDYVFIAHAIANNRAISNQIEFDDFTSTHGRLSATFKDLIFQQRVQLTNNRPDLWEKLNPLYPNMQEFLHNYGFKKNLYIITTKKLLFVHKILNAHQIDMISENVLDTEGNLSKRQIVEAILIKLRMDPFKFHFVDDQVDTLLKMQPVGVQLVLANWGYVTKSQEQTAVEHGIRSFSLQDFYHFFGNDHPSIILD